MADIKKNIGWSSILTTLNHIFPLITYPYVSRILGVNNIGICNFVDSVINYYSIFAMMGMSYVAIREVAYVKSDAKQLSKTFSSLLTLNLITTVFMMVVLTLSIFLVPRFHEHADLMFIGVFKLLFNTFLVEWLYRGLEDFRYITIRSIIVRILYVVSVFIFVKERSDYPIYYLLLALTIVINATVNLFHSRKFVNFSFRGLSFSPFIKAFIILGIYHFLTSLYKSFNIVYLGFVAGDEQVGYYTTATKLHGMILALFTAFTGVMMPRMATLISSGNRADFNKLFRKSIQVLFVFSFPLICLGVVYSDQIVRIISGPGYELAIPCMQIVMPLVFIIGYEQILVNQVLMTLKRDRSIFVNSIIGASVGILLNLCLVPYLNSVGSAIVWIGSEFAVLLSSQYFASKYASLKFPYLIMIRYISVSIPLLCVLIALHCWNPIGMYTIFIAAFFTFVYFATIELYFFKNEIILNLLKNFKNKINGKE